MEAAMSLIPTGKLLGLEEDLIAVGSVEKTESHLFEQVVIQEGLPNMDMTEN